MQTFFEVEGQAVTAASLFVIAGPCVIENESLTMEIALALRDICRRLEMPLIFKASFDKANRSSSGSFRGPGLQEGLRILARIRRETGLPVLSDVHEASQVPAAAEALSVLQIPAFLCRQTDLLSAAGRSGLPVNIKKGQFMAPADMALAVKKVAQGGDSKVILTERGSFFGYRDLVVDFRSIPIMKETGCPVVIDATHSVQQPGAAGGVSGGDARFIPLIASAGVAAGADGVFLEVHPRPEQAASDGANSLPLDRAEALLRRLQALFRVGA